MATTTMRQIRMKYSSTIQYEVNIYLPLLITGELHQVTKGNELHVAYSLSETANQQDHEFVTRSTRIRRYLQLVHRVPEYIEYQSAYSIRYPNSPRYNTRVYMQVRIRWIEYYAVYYYGHIRPLVHTEPGSVQNVHYSRARRTDDITLIGPIPPLQICYTISKSIRKL